MSNKTHHPIGFLFAFVLVAVLAGSASAQCVGTQTTHGDDIAIAIEINAGSSSSQYLFGGSGVIDLYANDSTQIFMETLTFGGNPYFLLLEDAAVTAPPPLAGLCVSGLTSTTILPAGTLQFEATFGPSQVYAGGGNGLIVNVQGVTVDTSAGNGVFASTDTLELRLN